MAAVAAVAAAVADLTLGTGTGTALGAGATAAVVGAATTVVKVAGAHLPAAHHRAGAAGQPGGPEQLRLQWLTALEVRGIRPFLDQQRVLSASTGAKKTGGGPALRGADKSAAARRRSVLEQSFGQLPEADGPFAGRRAELGRIRQWAQAARAATETRPTVVVLHGEPGSGRTTLAVRAAHELRDHFRGAVVVDLRGGSREEAPLSTREALLHLLNRLGAPREQLLFRERSSPRPAAQAARRAVPPASDRSARDDRAGRRLGPGAGARPGAGAVRQPGPGHRPDPARPARRPAGLGARAAGARAGHGGAPRSC